MASYRNYTPKSHKFHNTKKVSDQDYTQCKHHQTKTDTNCRTHLEHDLSLTACAAEKIIDFLGIQAIRKKPVGKLPYGMQKRVELGRALAAEPDLLLLDEPMAGMNIEEKEDMVRFIIDIQKERDARVVLVEHDLGVVMDISDRIYVLDFGELIGSGTPEEVVKIPKVIDAYIGEE